MSIGESEYIVSFDARQVSCKRPDGSLEQVEWSQLDQITVEATAAADQPAMIWILWGKERKSGCVFPDGAKGSEALLGELQNRLANFNEVALEEAAKATENRTYMVWQAGPISH